jgi:hypothetical protein
MPLLVEKAWFGPRRLAGWGWTPVRWQGWAVIAVFLAGIVACDFLLSGTLLKVVADVALVVLLLVVCALTGTRPGGGFRIRR